MANLEVKTDYEGEFSAELARLGGVLPDRINATADNAEHGLARLVLAIVDLVRRLLEKQAVRRIEGGSLTEEQIEKLGETFMKLEERMKELKTAFGVRDDDLDIRLGPMEDLL